MTEGKKLSGQMVFGLDIGTRSIVGTVGYRSNNRFYVVAQRVKEHETRAMLDGQIHDILKVSMTIRQVKEELEAAVGMALTDVCIAAAGRVLRTVNVSVENEYGSDKEMTKEDIYELTTMGVEKAYEMFQAENDTDMKFYCVGYSVVHYYINHYPMSNPEGHKARVMGADMIATFLPDDVVDGLYKAVELAGLQVANMTLEPIAAIQVAIPEMYRMLNIALVDVGAGTSDICITKEGTIVAYGMIPMAGDAVTDVIVQAHLVDFATAEEIKIAASMHRKVINYKDIMGIAAQTTPEEVFAETEEKVGEITELVAKKILELNGGKSVSAVFVVGGGGKLPDFVRMLAECLKLPAERVALRGEEVLGAVTFPEDVKKDPMLVTPIGICLNYYEQKNNFIFVQVNSLRVKLYDNSRLTIVDAALAVGFPNDGLFPKRGTALEFFVNGEKRMVRGEEGEAANILLNGRPAGINTPIEANDVIEIVASTAGGAAHMMVGELAEYKKSIEFTVNKKTIVCPKFARANGELVSEYYDIKTGDKLEIQDFYTLRQLLDFMDVMYRDGIYVNHMPAGEDEKIYDKFSVDFDLSGKADVFHDVEQEEDLGEVPEEGQQEPVEEAKEEDTLNQAVEGDGTPAQEKENVPENGSPVSAETEVAVQECDLKINVNSTPVVLKGKREYRVVDILDFYEFDVSTAHGNRVVIKVNGAPSGFSTRIAHGDFVELYWEQ